MSRLESLRLEEKQIEYAIEEQRPALVAGWEPTRDVAAMAVRLSEVKKQIGALTVGQLCTA